MDTKPTSSQIKANPISNQTIKENDVQEKNDIFDAATQQTGENQVQQQKQQQQSTQKFLKPDFIYCPNNKSIDELIKTYPHLKSLKESKEQKFDEVKEAESFVIRSNNDDDIHRAIKYGVWCSTPPNNQMLDEAFKKASKEGKDIYLFYSVVKSGQFVGVAKLKSELKEETFAYWWQHSKWRGHFNIEWLFVKDITYKQFDQLKNSLDLPVIRSKDGTKVDWTETGKPMISIFQKANENQNIFQDFDHMDQREQFQRYIKSNQAASNNNNGQNPQQQNANNYQQNYQGGQQQGGQVYNQQQSQQAMYFQQQQQQYYQQYYQYYGMQPRYTNAYPPQSGNNAYRQQNYNGNYQGNQQGGPKKYYKKNYNNNNNNGYNKNYNNNGYKKNYNNNYNNQQQPNEQDDQQQSQGVEAQQQEQQQ